MTPLLFTLVVKGNMLATRFVVRVVEQLLEQADRPSSQP